MMKLHAKKGKKIVQRRSKTGNDKGFTLLEVIIAISILSVGILGVATMQTSSMRGNAFADGVTAGTTWAADRLEKIMDFAYQDYDNANLLDTDNDGQAGLNDATAATADFQQVEGQYTIYWNVAADDIFDDTKTISVIVTWTDHGVQKNVTVRNVIPRII